MRYGNGGGILEEVIMLVFLRNPLRAHGLVEVLVSEILEAFSLLTVFVFHLYCVIVLCSSL